MRHVQTARLAQWQQLVRTALHKRATHRWRGTKQGQQQKGMAAKVADQPKVIVVAQAGQRPVVVNARNRLHAPPVTVAQPHAVHAFGAAYVAGAVAPQRNGFVSGQATRHAGCPQHLVTLRTQAAHGVLVNLAQLRQARLDAVMHAGDEFELRLAVVGGDVRMGQRTAQRGGVRRERQLSVGPRAQAFFFKATAHAAQLVWRQGIQPLLCSAHTEAQERSGCGPAARTGGLNLTRLVFLC